jgi:glycosyltransferase involved in cell wall biosynthesis
MANFAPPWGPFRRVVTIHDMQYRAVPELLSPLARSATHALVSTAAHRADRVIAVSRAGRDEICAGLGIPAGRIDVIHNGVREAPTEIDTSGLRERYGLGEHPIVLTVATQLPHKNLSALIPALALMAPAQRPALVIVGHGTDDGRLRAAALAADVAESVHLLGARTNHELERLYALAGCLVLPTLHEGFGMPVLEAMAHSVPVACSDIPSLREVAGDAALYFDPRAPAQIATQISELIGNQQLAHSLREKGLANARRFSWSAAATMTLASYDRALGSS